MHNNSTTDTNLQTVSDIPHDPQVKKGKVIKSFATLADELEKIVAEIEPKTNSNAHNDDYAD